VLVCSLAWLSSEATVAALKKVFTFMRSQSFWAVSFKEDVASWDSVSYVGVFATSAGATAQTCSFVPSTLFREGWKAEPFDSSLLSLANWPACEPQRLSREVMSCLPTQPDQALLSEDS